MVRKRNEPMAFVCVNLPWALMERIRAQARQRGVNESRNVPYVELFREVLEREFPAPTAPQTERQ